MELETNFMLCACHSPEHTLQFTYDADENELFICAHLNKLPFHKRLWNGFKYILGMNVSRYGHYEEYIFDNRDALRLIDILKKIEMEDYIRKVMEEKTTNSEITQGTCHCNCVCDCETHCHEEHND